MKPVERRMSVAGLELRDGSGGPVLSGYASTYDQPYSMGWYTEQVAPGAFRRSLGRRPDVRLLVNHDGLPLARTTSGTLSLDGDDPKGLRVEARLDGDDPDVERIVPKLRRGDLNAMSFGFRIMGDDGDEWSPDMKQRTLRSLDIHDGDVSVVTYPANPHTSVAMRGAGMTTEGLASALRVLHTRAASPDEVAALLQQALGYFAAIDDIVDAAQMQVSTALGVPNPDADDDEPARAKKQPYGDVDYADPGYQSDGKKRYPIDSAAHVKAAWSYINQKGNQASYSADELANIMGRIKAAAKKFGVEIEQSNAAPGPDYFRALRLRVA